MSLTFIFFFTSENENLNNAEYVKLEASNEHSKSNFWKNQYVDLNFSLGFYLLMVFYTSRIYYLLSLFDRKSYLLISY